MGDQVGVAADRRGEVAVGGTAQAGVAEVAIRVVGLLQRAKHKRCIRLASVAAALGLSGDQPARLTRQLAGLLGRDRVRQRRRRDVERRQLLDQPADPLGIGLLVDPVEGRDAPALEQLRDPLVGEDHQVLDQPVGLGLRHRVGSDDLARPRSGTRARSSPPRARSAAGARARAAAASRAMRQRLGDPLRRPRPAGEDLVELLVVEAGIRAHQAAVEARRQRLAGLRDLDLGGDREPVLIGNEAAGVAREDLRQHRRDPPRHVGGVGSAAGLLLESAARANVRGDVGDVDPEAKAALRPRRGHRVVEVVGARRDRR